MLHVLIVAAGLALDAAQGPHTQRDPLAVYGPVIASIRTEKPGWSGLRFVLDTRINDRFGPRERPPVRAQAADLLRRLQEGGWVDGICSSGSKLPCGTGGDVAVLRLGPVVALPDSARLKENADVSVDVMLTTPCPAPPESERCRIPDLVEYRYLLRVEPGGAYRVVSRRMIGAI